jgi:hypothetical protein
MPWIEDTDSGISPDRPVTPTEYSSTVTTGEFIGALRQREDLVTNFADSIAESSNNTFTPEPDYDPYTDMEGYEGWAEELHGANSRAEMLHLKNKINSERQVAEVISSGTGAQQFMGAASLIATDPTMLIPIGGALWKTYRTGGRILEGAARTAAYGAAVTTGQEVFLQNTQLTRTGEESVHNIAAATLLSGLLGGTVGALSPKSVDGLVGKLDSDMSIPADILSTGVRVEREISKEADEITSFAVKNKIDLTSGQINEAARLRREGFDNDNAVADVIAQREAFGESTVGAAALRKFSDEDLEIRGLKKVKAAYKKLPKFLRNPALDLAVSVSRKTREYGNLLADHSLALNMHRQGNALAQSVETKMKAYNVLKAQYMIESQQLWKAYRTRINQLKKVEGEIPEAERIGSRKDGSLTFAEFFGEASKASRRGDTHGIPEVDAVAKSARKNVFSPIFQRAKEVGFFKDLDEASVKTAETWLIRKPNIPKILKERAKFKQVVLQDLIEKEGKKAEVRKTLQPLVEAIDNLTKAIKKAEKPSKKKAVVNDILKMKNELKKLEEEIKDIIESYEGKSAKKAKSAIKKSKDGEIGEDARGEIINAAKTILKTIQKEKAEIDELAEQIIDRYTNQTGGRLPYEAHTGGQVSAESAQVRGSMKHRVWDIDDAKIEPWLENDLNTLVDSYTRTMSSDVELMGQFETLDVNVLKKEIQDDYNKLRVRKASGERGLQKVDLDAEMKRDMLNLENSIEKLRGMYAQPDDYASSAHVFERAALAWNFARLLGDMVTSSIPDIGRHVMTHGIGRTFNDSFVSMIKDYKGFKMMAREAQELGTSLDMTTSKTSLLRSHMDDFTPMTGKIDAISNKTSQIAATFTGMNIWNSAQKTFAGVMVQNRMVKSIIELSKGGKVDAAELEYLGRHGISKPIAKRIAKQFESHGEIREVVNVPNARSWTDAEARNIFRNAVRHSVDEIIVTPGLDRPLWMSRPGWRMIGQFKSFTFSSAMKVTLAGLQRSDAAALQGVLLMTFLGSNVYFAKSWLAGREISDDPAVWIAEGVDRSGITGWFFDVNNIIEKATAGRVGVNALRGGPSMSRYASRNAVGALFGPTYGLAQDLFNITGSAFSEEWDEKDTHAVRKILPMQNIPYLRGIFDSIERGANSALGLGSGEVRSYGTE